MPIQSIIPRVGRLEVLQATVTELLLYVGLFTNDLTLSDDLTLLDVTDPVFNGYALKPIAHWTPPLTEGVNAVSFGDPAIFTFTDGAPPLPVRGWYARRGPVGPLVSVWKSNGPGFQMDADNPSLIATVRLNLRAVPLVA